MMEATFGGLRDPSKTRHVMIGEKGVPTVSCSFCTTSAGVPFYQRVAAFFESFGALKTHQFVSKKHLTSNFKKSFFYISFILPPQKEVDKEPSLCRNYISLRATNTCIVRTPRGCPPKHLKTVQKLVRTRPIFQKNYKLRLLLV